MADVNSSQGLSGKDTPLCQIIRICGGNDLLNLVALPTVVTPGSSFQ